MGRPNSPGEDRPGLILIGTNTLHKAEELGAMLSPPGSPLLQVLNLRQWEEKHFSLTEAVEGADSFVDNARLKALQYAQASGLPVLADDSGLSVAALNGAPGVMSARYGGAGVDDDGRCENLWGGV